MALKSRVHLKTQQGLSLSAGMRTSITVLRMPTAALLDDIAREAAEGLESGVVGVNTFSVSRPELPFGGVKDSGYGREGGAEGLLEFLFAKAVAR